MISEGDFQWSLKNDSGRTLMSGPERLPYPINPLILFPRQSKDIFEFYRAIKDTSGAPVVAGSCTLEVVYDSMLISLDLSIG